jgi:hypothetical protein
LSPKGLRLWIGDSAGRQGFFFDGVVEFGQAVGPFEVREVGTGLVGWVDRWGLFGRERLGFWCGEDGGRELGWQGKVDGEWVDAPAIVGDAAFQGATGSGADGVTDDAQGIAAEEDTARGDGSGSGSLVGLPCGDFEAAVGGGGGGVDGGIEPEGNALVVGGELDRVEEVARLTGDSPESGGR